MDEEIKKALEILRKGGTLLYPTDTVWGIGCDASNSEAVKKVFKLKQREESKALIVLIDNANLLNKYVKDVSAVAWDLIEYADKPLTIIFDKVHGLPVNLIAADGTLGIRVVKDEFCRKLIHKLGKPIVSTSANVSGAPTPACFAEITEEIIKGVDYVVNWRQHEMHSAPPSSIIKLAANGEFKIIRK